MSSFANFSWTIPDDLEVAEQEDARKPGASFSEMRRRSLSDSAALLFGDNSSGSFGLFDDSFVSHCSDDGDKADVAEEKGKYHPQNKTVAAKANQEQKLRPSRGLSTTTTNNVKVAPENAKVNQVTEADEDSAAATLLHRTCQQFPNNLGIVQTALSLDTNAARRIAIIPAVASATANHADGAKKYGMNNQLNKNNIFSPFRATNEPYQIPINIAVYHDASLDVIQTLIEAAPEMLLKQDPGSRVGLTTLLVALQRQPKNVDLIKLILKLRPQAASTKDIKHNSPLHVACQYLWPVEIIRSIYYAYPEALSAANFHGETPRHVAERTNGCSEDIIDFIHQVRLRRAPQALNLV